ncbi:MAG: hypothetical protein U0793_22725 [Gemmataceae bacterium]
MRIIVLLVLLVIPNAVAREKPKPAERPTFLYAAPVTGFSAGDEWR